LAGHAPVFCQSSSEILSATNEYSEPFPEVGFFESPSPRAVCESFIFDILKCSD
jgi:hypothetical protein